MLRENYKNIMIIFNNPYHMHMPFQSASGKKRKRSYITVNPQYFSRFLREA